MNGLERTQHRVLVGMFIDIHRPERRYMTRQDFQSDYYTQVDTRLFNSLASNLRKEGVVKAIPQGGTFAIRLHSDAYATVLGRILEALSASTFEVDWQNKRIITDGGEQNTDGLIPCPNHWMLLTCEKKDGLVPMIDVGPATKQAAGRDINNFYGTVHGGAIHNDVETSANDWWTRWGTIFGGASVIVTMGVLLAEWLL